MQKPRDPNEPGGAMTAVAMIISLGIAPVTAFGMCIGAVIGIAGGFSAGIGGIASGLLWGAGAPLAAGITLSAALIAYPFISYPIEMAIWKKKQKSANHNHTKANTNDIVMPDKKKQITKSQDNSFDKAPKIKNDFDKNRNEEPGTRNNPYNNDIDPPELD